MTVKKQTLKPHFHRLDYPTNHLLKNVLFSHYQNIFFFVCFGAKAFGITIRIIIETPNQ